MAYLCVEKLTKTTKKQQSRYQLIKSVVLLGYLVKKVKLLWICGEQLHIKVWWSHVRG